MLTMLALTGIAIGCAAIGYYGMEILAAVVTRLMK